MSELQTRVQAWFLSNKGHANAEAAIHRALREFDELLKAVEQGNLEHIQEEAADVMLCLLVFADIAGFDLLEAVNRKHAINEQRKWRVDEAGCLHHIKGSDPRE